MNPENSEGSFLSPARQGEKGKAEDKTALFKGSTSPKSTLMNSSIRDFSSPQRSKNGELGSG